MRLSLVEPLLYVASPVSGRPRSQGPRPPRCRTSVMDIARCVSLCNAFPTLFDLVDKSDTMEVYGVAKNDFMKVADHCYLCDPCFMTKCPYVPPHPWNVDFPHLMLRAKHVQHKKGEHSFRDKLLSNTRGLGRIAGIPVVAEVVNAVNGTKAGRKLLEATLGVAASAPLP